jgi:hypothetical protein
MVKNIDEIIIVQVNFLREDQVVEPVIDDHV